MKEMISNSDDLILEHYRKVALYNGLKSSASMDDPYIREHEIKFIIKEIDRYIIEQGDHHIKIMDVGCGNGYLLSVLRDRYKSVDLVGIEFSPDLFKLASSRELLNTDIVLGDIRKSLDLESFDIVISERVIINILERRDQYQAVSNIVSALKNGGLYLMIESFREPLTELNHARKEACLSEVKESYQNNYIYELFIHKCKKFGFIETASLTPQNFLSTHFYITRVFHKMVRPLGGKVKFSRMSEFFVDALPDSIGNYSPILFRIFKKVSLTDIETD